MILIALTLSTMVAFGQEEERPEIKPVQFYIGFQPGLTVVPFDEYRNAFDINILPVTIQYAINRHWALRIHSIWDIEIRPENFPTVISTIGMELAAQYYLSLKNNEEGHRGFFLAPVITPAYHRQNEYYSMGLAGEAGFSFLFGYKWSLSVSAQAGMKMQFDPDNPYIRIIPYSIPVLSLGIWL